MTERIRPFEPDSAVLGGRQTELLGQSTTVELYAVSQVV